MAMVLKLIDAQGQPIKGESKVKGHEGEIDVLAWSWGLSEAAGKVTLQDLSIRKSVDLASVPILRVAETSEHLRQGILTVTKAGTKGEELDFLIITLDTGLVDSVNIAEEPKEDLPTEAVSLKWERVEVKYTTGSGTETFNSTRPKATARRKK
jgi:type VI secretion system secreted protein Hcp